MLYRIKEHVKNTVVAVLCHAFNGNEEYKYLPDIARSKIMINRAWPYQAIKFPLIVITTSSGDGLMRVMQDEFWEEEKQDYYIDGVTYDGSSGLRYGGGFRISISIDVAAEDTITREKLIDYMTMYLRWLYRDHLREHGLNLIDITFNGEHQKAVGNDYIYFDSLTVEFYTEWFESVTTAESERIHAFDLHEVFSLMLDGTTV